MTPDEMYLLARTEEEEPREEGVPVPPYSEIVRRATGRISSRLALPDFPTWVEEYRKNPERFENELLGLWRVEARKEGEEEDPDGKGGNTPREGLSR
jgi:hypothetical protein